MNTSTNMLDLIGIGALNIDFIASREKVTKLEPDTIPELNSRFEHGTEIKVDETEIDNTLTQMGASAFDTFLGGSSLNTIHALAYTCRALKLGYIGAAGNASPHDHGFIETLKMLGIDTRFVHKSSNPAGRCISYISDGERTLLTTPGANTEVAGYLESNYDGILEYLAKSKIVHVTSFFDDDTPAILSRVLKSAKEKNPWLRISFDPGYEWTENLTNSIKDILRTCDFVYFNNREFQILGHHRPGKQDIHLAREIFHLCDTNSILIVLKSYDSIKLFYKIQGRIMERHFSNSVLPHDVIEDATGAGDIFAAGFLCSMLIPGLEISHGVDLGLRMVRSKLLVAGYSSFDRYSAIFNSLINDVTSSISLPLDMVEKKDRMSDFIFIGHGRNAVWALLEKHLKEDLSLPCRSFESEPQAGRHVLTILSELLDTSTFAIIIMTAEDEMNNEKIRARQNVLHEIGLFHGRLGFNKVVLLLQSGVEKFSNIDGLQYIEFEGTNIQTGFHELDNVLRREHILS